MTQRTRIIVLLLFVSINLSNAQTDSTHSGKRQKESLHDKVNVVIGSGYPELINIGLRFQLKQTQLGFSVGSWPSDHDEKFLSVSGDLFFHFAGVSTLSERRPWYGRIGLNYAREENEYAIDKYVFFNTRMGRDFNISKRLGIAIDFGVLIELSHTETRKQPSSGWDLSFELPVLPSFGLALFYRI